MEQKEVIELEQMAIEHIGDCIDNEKFSLYFKQMETLFDIVKCGICKEIKRLDNEFSIK